MPTKKLTEKIDIRRLRKRIEDSINQKAFLTPATRKSLLNEYDRFYRSKPLLLRFEKKLHDFTNDVNSKSKVKIEKKRVEEIKSKLKKALHSNETYLTFYLTLYVPPRPPDNTVSPDHITYKNVNYNCATVRDGGRGSNLGSFFLKKKVPFKPTKLMNKLINSMNLDNGNRVITLLQFEENNNTFHEIIEDCERYDSFIRMYDTIKNSEQNILIQLTHVEIRDANDTPLDIETAESFNSNGKQRNMCGINYYRKLALNKLECTSEYVKTHYFPYSCWLNLIVDIYKTPIEKYINGRRTPNSKKTRFELTHLYVHNLIKPQNTLQKEKNGYSINDVKKFFEEYNLKLYVFDINMNLLTQTPEPTYRNKKISPFVLYVVYHNKHITRLTENLDRLAQKILSSEDVLKIPNSKYGLFKREEQNLIEFADFDRALELFNKVNEETMSINLIVRYKGSSCRDLWKHINDEFGIQGKVIFSFNTISFNTIIYTFEYDKKIIRRITFQALEEEGVNSTTEMKNLDVFKAYEDKKAWMYNHLLTKTYLSHYHPNVRSMLRLYMKPPLVGQVCEAPNAQRFSGVKFDFNKFYTSILQDIEFIPKVNQFDTFIDYKGEPLVEYNIYFVHKNRLDGEYPFYKYSLCYGFNLMGIENEITILYVLSVSKVVSYKAEKTTMNEVIKNIYEDKNLKNPLLKKNLINHLVGMYNKAENKTSKVDITEDESEANLWVQNQGGEKIYLPFTKEREEPDILFAVVKENTAELDDGFRLISLMVYDIAHKRLLALKKMVEETKMIIEDELISLKVYYLNTDCVDIGYTNNTNGYTPENHSALIDKFKAEHSELFSTADKNSYEAIGKLKVESVELINRPIKSYIKRIFTDNLYSKMDTFIPPINRIVLVDEFDRTEICNKIHTIDKTKSNRLIIEANIAGAGKTSAWTFNAIENHEKTIIVAPYNCLCLSLRDEMKRNPKVAQGQISVITLSKLIGCFIQSGEEKISGKQYDVSGVKRIIFDEIFLYSVADLHKIKYFMDSHSDILFGATGDENQLAPIDDSVVVRDPAKYYSDIIHSIFPNIITLEENKRCETELDRAKMKAMTREIRDLSANLNDFQTQYEIKKIFKKYGVNIIYKIGDVKTSKNVSAINDTCEMVNDHVHKMLGHTERYSVGLKLVCRKMLNVKIPSDVGKKLSGRTVVNEEYEIMEIRENSFIIWDNDEDSPIFEVKRTDINQHFRHIYSKTCHSYQGLSENEPITIFDLEHFSVDKRWVYTAVTRTTAFKNLNVFYGNIPYNNLRVQVNKMIHGHKEVDNEKKRDIIGEYVDYDWVVKQLKKRICPHCHAYFNTSGKACFSINRKDVNLGHTKKNCELTCYTCNVMKIGDLENFVK